MIRQNPVAPARYVKICGITRAQDALFAVSAGATAIGLNFVPTSRRRVDEDTALRIADAVRGKVELVGVVADRASDDLEALRRRLGLDFVQLHGSESPSALEGLLPHAFKAARIATAADVARADEFGGERLLVDACVPGELGGTGKAFDWDLVVGLARRRKVVLAGGLTKDNVAHAVRVVDPWGIDVASGVESAPGIKDPALVVELIRAARGSGT